MVQSYKEWGGKVLTNPPLSAPPPYFDKNEIRSKIEGLPYIDIGVTQISSAGNNVLVHGCMPDSGATVTVQVTDMKPWMYVKEPRGFTGDLSNLKKIWNNLPIEWPKWRTDMMVKMSSWHSSSSKNDQCMSEDSAGIIAIADITLEERTSAIGFQYNRPERLLKVAFEDATCFYSYKMYMARNYVPTNGMNSRAKLRLIHSNWSPAEQFPLMSGLRINETCRVAMDPRAIRTGISSATIELRRQMRHLIPLTNASSTSKPFTICSFDCETVSKLQMIEARKPENQRSRNDYWATPTEPHDRVVSLSSEWYKFGESESYLRTVHCLGSTVNLQADALYLSFCPSSPSTATDAEWDEKERALLLHWAAMVDKMDAELMGFNSMTFDLVFLTKRAKVLGCFEEFARLLSRFKGQARNMDIQTSDRSMEGSRGAGKFKERPEYVRVPGRVHFDIYRAAAANEKMHTYSLKELCSEILKDPSAKEDLPYRDIAVFWTTGTDEQRGLIHRYCSQDSVASKRLDIKRRYFPLYLEVGNLTDTNINDMMNRGVVQRSEHLVIRKVYTSGWYIDDWERMWVQASFGSGSIQCPQCTESVRALGGGGGGGGTTNKGKPKKPKLVKIPPRQRVFNATFSGPDNSQTGRSQTTHAVIQPHQARYCSHDVPSYPPGGMSYEGGTVLNPRTEFFNEPVFTLDFASLYPSSMQAALICGCTMIQCVPGTLRPNLDPSIAVAEIYTQMRRDSTPAQVIESPLLRYVSRAAVLESGSMHTMKLLRVGQGLHTVYFVQEFDGRKPPCIVPEIQEALVKARKLVKKQIKDAELAHDKALEEMLEVRSKAIKVCANGFYGALASVFSYAMLPLAMATTFVGRMHIAIAQEEAEKAGCIVIYGDTDSIMCTIPGSVSPEFTTKKENESENDRRRRQYRYCIEFAAKIEKTINSVVIEPEKIEFENLACPFKAFCQKNYVAWMRSIRDDAKTGEEIGQVNKIKRRGVESERRDYCQVVRSAVLDIVKVMFEDGGKADRCIKIVEQVSNKFAERKYGAKDLERTVKVRSQSEYKNDQLWQVKMFERMRKRGVRLEVGSRVPFLYCAPINSRERMLKDNDLVFEMDYVLANKREPNLVYYLDKQVRNAMLKVLSGISPAIDMEVNRLVNNALRRISAEDQSRMGQRTFT